MKFHEIIIVWGIVRKLPLSSSSKILVHGMKHTCWAPRRWAMATDSCLRCQCDNIQKICPEQEQIAGWLVTGGCRCVMIIYHMYIYIHIYIHIYIYLFIYFWDILLSACPLQKQKCDDDPQQDAGAVPSDATSAEALNTSRALSQLQYKLFDIYNGLDINLTFWSNNCLIAKHIRLISNCFY